MVTEMTIILYSVPQHRADTGGHHEGLQGGQHHELLHPGQQQHQGPRGGRAAKPSKHESESEVLLEKGVRVTGGGFVPKKHISVKSI